MRRRVLVAGRGTRRAGMSASIDLTAASTSWAARSTSAVTASWTCEGVRVPSRYFLSPRNLELHAPESEQGGGCDLRLRVVRGHPGALGQELGGHGDELVHVQDQRLLRLALAPVREKMLGTGLSAVLDDLDDEGKLRPAGTAKRNPGVVA
jgi:hypothetical protein